MTLNLGLRWDMESPVTERHDKLYLWDPDAPAPLTINPGYNFAAAARGRFRSSNGSHTFVGY
ncbi:MAG: hypothetical protein WKF37_09805 [Bryobacteraceae bacterium]